MGPRSTPTAHLATARDRVRGRRRELVDERDAVDQFCRRVERLPVAGADPGLAPDADCASVVRAGDGVARLRRAFEATVMAVPHYRERYGDPFTERLATELGPEVARTVRRATALTPRLETRVTDAASAARERRADRLARLDHERARLDRIEATVHDLLDALPEADDAFDDGTASAPAHGRLVRVERRCVALAADRRATLDRDDARRGLLADVYAELPVTDPILATVEAIDRLVAGHRSPE
jgi:hypothetical protein